MNLKITKGVRKAPVRAVIYGVEGVGKTSLAAQLPNPLFLDMEEGTAQLDVARAQIDTADELRNALNTLSADPQGFQTIVIDSADWAERITCEALLKKSGKKSIEDFGFGKGFVMIAEEMARLLTACDTLVHRGIHVVWIAHAKTVRVSPPDMVDGFDRYELKMAKQTAPLFKEWADLLLFANFETVIVKGNDGRVKGEGGKRRFLYTERAAAWDAKNRYGLPETLPLDHGTIAPELAAVFSGASKPVAAAPAPQAPAQLATAAQVGKLTDLAQHAAALAVIEKALAHYGALEVAELSAASAEKVIARCTEEMNK